MNARNQLLVVLTALMLVCSSGAMVTAKAPGDTIDQSSEVSEDEYDSANETVNETANETVADEQVVDNETDAADNESAQQSAYVTFNDQTTDGETVVVENVTLASPGFVTIHDSSLLVGNVIDSVIGTSEYLEEGTHENVTVTLDEPLEESETLIAMPHRDTNQNQTYDFVETEGEEDVPFLTPDDEPVTDEAVVTVDGAAVDEEPVDDNVTDEEPVVDEVEDNVTEEEPIVDEEEDNVTEEEPVLDEEEDNVTEEEPVLDEEEDNVTEEEPVDEMPMDELPAADDAQPVFVTVENPTIEDLTVENVTVYVLVVGEDVDADQIADQLDNVTEDDNVTEEEPILDEEEEPVLEDEDNITEDEDNVTEEEPLLEDEDNVTEDENVTEDDNITEDEPLLEDDENVTEEEDALEATAFNISDLEAPENATIGENITVTANVSNPTDEERTEAIQFRLEGDLVAEQNVTLESDESEIVEFEVDTSDLEPGEYIHMVLGDEAGEVAMIELTEAEDVGDEEIDEINETEDDIGLDNETNESDTGDGFGE